VPLYEYECKKCHHRFERIQKTFSDPAPACPKCQGEVEQLLHAPAVQFKGSGWYVTDYARGSSAGTAPKDGDRSGGDKPSGDKSGSDKSESKTESKSEAKGESEPKRSSKKRKD
jgi:putative FmdB family regulatory protein